MDNKDGELDLKLPLEARRENSSDLREIIKQKVNDTYKK